jgi:hypothetical protein
VVLGEQVIGTYWRNDPLPMPLPRPQQRQQRRGQQAQQHRQGAAGYEPAADLHILVEGMGRNNFASSSSGFPDPKGLVSNVIRLDERLLTIWSLQPIELLRGTLQMLAWQPCSGASGGSSSSKNGSAAARIPALNP